MNPQVYTFITTRAVMTVANRDSLPSSFSGHTAPGAPTAPYPPSSVEAQYYYYGIHSGPRLVARSSTDLWVESEARLKSKELHPLSSHPLQEIWEAAVGPAMISYLDAKGVKWTSLDPIRIGYADDHSTALPLIWIGVLPGSLTPEICVGVATGCKEILSTHGIHGVHVEIREPAVSHSPTH